MPERFKVTKAAESDIDDRDGNRDEEAALGHLLEEKQGKIFFL